MSTDKALVVAAETDPVIQPRHWDKAVSCAYLRLIGRTQEEAAISAGVGERTLRMWEKCSWWRLAQEEASSRWLNDLTAHARDAVLSAVKEGNAALAWEVVQRTVPGLTPKQKHEVSGPDGQPLPVTFYIPMNNRGDEDE